MSANKPDSLGREVARLLLPAHPHFHDGVAGAIDAAYARGREDEAKEHQQTFDELREVNNTNYSRFLSAEDERIEWVKRGERAEELCDELRSQLAHRHIIGKAYDVTRENINRLAGELDDAKEELKEALRGDWEIRQSQAIRIEELRAAVERLLEGFRACIDAFNLETYDDALERARALIDQKVSDELRKKTEK